MTYKTFIQKKHKIQKLEENLFRLESKIKSKFKLWHEFFKLRIIIAELSQKDNLKYLDKCKLILDRVEKLKVQYEEEIIK